LFSPAITHALPVAQLLLASRGRAITAGFRANPWSTLGFPAAALLLTAFREKIPGLGPTVVAPPEVQRILGTGTPPTLVVLLTRQPQGSIVRFTLATGSAQAPDPDRTSSEFRGSATLASGDQLKLRAFIGDAGSDVVPVTAP
jgi:hypothetical protein